MPTASLRLQPQGRRVWFDEARKLFGCPEQPTLAGDCGFVNSRSAVGLPSGGNVLPFFRRWRAGGLLRRVHPWPRLASDTSIRPNFAFHRVGDSSTAKQRTLTPSILSSKVRGSSTLRASAMASLVGIDPYPSFRTPTMCRWTSSRLWPNLTEA